MQPITQTFVRNALKRVRRVTYFHFMLACTSCINKMFQMCFETTMKI